MTAQIILCVCTYYNICMHVYIHVRLYYTVVPEIFAGCNFREFRDKGRVRENLFTKLNMGGYKMAAFVKTDFR